MDNPMLRLGPNVKRLVINRISIVAIPKDGGPADGIKFFMDHKLIRSTTEEAIQFVLDALDLIRTAAEPNPWKDRDNEAIAGELLRQIDEKQVAKKTYNGA